MIFFDQRGIGYSEPFMDCPEVSEDYESTLAQNLSAAQWLPGRVAAQLACQERLLSEGVDLPAYNSASSAADVNDLRQALGYDQVNLLGLSYGTRLALTVMRDFPDTVRSVILDSPVPPQENLLVRQGPSAQASLDLIFERCAADEACAAAYPDLESALDGLLTRLDQEPLELHVQHIISRSLTPVVVNGDLFMAGLFFSLYDFAEIALLPKIISDTYLEAPGYRNRLADFMQVPLIMYEFSSEGQRYSVLCREEVPFATLEDALAQYADLLPRLGAFLEQDTRAEMAICDGWQGGAAAAIENQAVHSDIPTLVLSGEFDPVTPPAFGDLVVETLSNGVHVEFPYSSHGVFSDRRCAREIAGRFLESPNSEPNLACIEALQRQPPSFITR